MIVCLDYGDRYVGVAVSDGEERTALRHSVIDQKNEEALSAIKKIVEDKEAEKLLVGVPISLSGDDTEQTRATRNFIEQLKFVVGDEMKIEEVDERLTSAQASQNIRNEGGRQEDEHAEAARLMLESFLTR